MMSLDKAIESGKEHREPYRRGKRIARSCRNHGSCTHCEGNRTHANKKREQKANVDYSKVFEQNKALDELVELSQEMGLYD